MPPTLPPWLIYGANGYTGQLIAELAVAAGLSPILAGRDAARLRPLSQRLGLEMRAFALPPPGEAASHELDRGLTGVSLVLHCAGPFSATARPMVDACLRAGAHYLDITGELAVFEEHFARHAEFQRAKVVVMSGVGFDVVPTDSMAAALASALPGAVRLELAFGGFARASRGTARTAVEGLANGGVVRRGGRLVPVPPARLVKDIAFADKARRCMAIPWGDLSTAYRTTSIPDITVFMAARPAVIRVARIAGALRGLLARPWVQAFLKAQVDRRVSGPSAEERATMRVQLWGRAEDAAGRAVEGVGECPEGYALTAAAALACVRRLLEQPAAVQPGAHTPAGAFGPALFTALPGCRLHVPR